MRGITALLLALTAAIGPVSAADKTHPEFLREQHAGSKTFVSAQPAATLFPDLLQATAACYLGDVEPGAGMANRGGAIGSLQSASREVTGELSADGRSAYIVVRAKGFFGAVQTNFLQIDIQEAAGTTNVTAF